MTRIRRRTAVLAAILAVVLLVVGLLAGLLLLDPPPQVPPEVTPDAPALPNSRALRVHAPPAVPAEVRYAPVKDTAPPMPTGAALADTATWSATQAEVIAAPDWKRPPVGIDGPVVVGAVVLEEDPDPECWVALEAVDDPERFDPSEVHTLSWGRFRLTGFEPGRYRVRARTDEGLAVYSEPFTVRDGAVADAGTLRLRGPGRLQGLVRDATGAMVAATVQLHGRDPATMEPVIHSRTVARGARGFELRPDDAGPFRLSVHGDAGWAEVEGTTDDTGAGWVEVRLRPWAGFDLALAEAPPGDTMTVRLGSWSLERLDEPEPRIVATGNGPGGRAGLREGLHRLIVTVKRSADGGRFFSESPWTLDLRLAPGVVQEVEVPR